MANKGGRPSKYDPSMCETVMEIMAVGATKEEAAAHLGIAKDTFYQWIKKHEEFSKAVAIAEELSYVWWLKQGRSNLCNKEFNSTLWYMIMKNLHKWSDRQEVKHNTEDSRIIIQMPK